LPLGLVILDLHRFKEVNDKHGHPRGDEVLRAAATTLIKTLRTSDSAFRIGGDEFALLLPQTDAAQGLALSRRIETVFEETVQPLQLSVRVSMDHGVATFPLDGEQVDQLIRVADERLYRLKQANHGRSVSRATTAPPQETPAPETPERSTSAPRTISIESKRPSEKTEEVLSIAASAAAAGISLQLGGTQAVPVAYTYPRKAERVSMGGTNAYALLGEQGGRRARVLDLGFGGVALEMETTENLPESLLAILHVPILPPVRVNLKPVWSRRTGEGQFRVGCCFVS